MTTLPSLGSYREVALPLSATAATPRGIRPSLGSYREVALPQGTIRDREVGSGVPIVFIHGILVNGTLWREVAPALADTYRCVLPDLPLGGNSLPMDRDADLSPGGVARLLADFLDALDLRDVILVGNDTGGAIYQLVIARHPARFAGLVLTNGDAYEAFFPPPLTPFQYGAGLRDALRRSRGGRVAPASPSAPFFGASHSVGRTPRRSTPTSARSSAMPGFAAIWRTS